MALAKVCNLDGLSLSIEQVAEVARDPDSHCVQIDPGASPRVVAGGDLRRTLVGSNRPIYGTTTGFGDSSRHQISPDKAGELQRNLIRYHLTGVGPETPEEAVRATMLIRANSLMHGCSGVRLDVVALLVGLLNAGVLPIIPERGSVGASGDLVPLCYLASLLVGEGNARRDGRIVPAAEALHAAGLQPIAPEAKEGLALINGTSHLAAFAALAVADATELAFVADLCTALATQVLRGDRGYTHPFIHAHKPHPGQVASAATIADLLAGGGLAYDPLVSDERRQRLNGAYRRLASPVQEAYSVRCAPNVAGVLRDTLDWARRWITVEINSATDNPLFDLDLATVHNGGNFYAGHAGQAMDSLKVAVASVGDLLDRQLALLVDERYSNGLPHNLVPPPKTASQAGLHHGFKGMQITASALTAEALKLSSPATVFSRSTEGHNQDKVSMGAIAARDARTVVELVEQVAAIHLHALCQAADLRGAELLSPATAAVHRLIREQVPFVGADRRMDHDIARIAALIGSGALRHAARPATVQVGGAA